MEELEVIVQRMIDAGESEENIKLVIEEYSRLGKTKDVAETGAPVASELQAPESGVSPSDVSLSESQIRFNELFPNYDPEAVDIQMRADRGEVAPTVSTAVVEPTVLDVQVGEVEPMSQAEFDKLAEDNRIEVEAQAELENRYKDILNTAGLQPYQFPQIKIGTRTESHMGVVGEVPIYEQADLETTENIITDATIAYQEQFSQLMSNEFETLQNISEDPMEYEDEIEVFHNTVFRQLQSKYGISKDDFNKIVGKGGSSGIYGQTINSVAKEAKRLDNITNLEGATTLDETVWNTTLNDITSNMPSAMVEKARLNTLIREKQRQINTLPPDQASDKSRLQSEIRGHQADIEKLATKTVSVGGKYTYRIEEKTDAVLASSYMDNETTKYRQEKLRKAQEEFANIVETEKQEQKSLDPSLTDFQAHELLMKSKAFNLQQLYVAGEKEKVSLTINRSSAPDLYSKLVRQGLISKDVDPFVTQNVKIPVRTLFDFGYDGRDFEGLTGFLLSAEISEDDRKKLLNYEDAKVRSQVELETLWELAYANNDPAAMDRGGGFKTFFETAAKSTLTHFTDVSPQEADRIVAGGEGRTTSAFLDRMLPYQEDYNTTNAEAIAAGEIDELGFTPEQYKALERTFGEEIGEGVGHFIPMLIELGIYSAGTGAVMSIPKIAKALAALRGGSAFQKAKFHGIMAMVEEGKMYAADMGGGTGAAFYAGGQLTRGATPFKNRFKYLDPFFQKVVKGGPVGAASSQFAVVANAGYQDLMNDADFSSVVNEHFGHLEFKDVIVESIVFSIVGATHVKKTDLMSTRRKINAVTELSKEMKEVMPAEGIENMTPEQKSKYASLLEAKQTLEQQIMVETNALELSPKNENFEANFNAKYTKPMEAALKTVIPEYKGLEVRFVEGKAELAEANNAAEFKYKEGKDGKDLIILDKNSYTPGKTGHELTHAAMENYFRKNPELEVKFTQKMEKLFNEFNFEAFEGTPLADFIKEGYKLDARTKDGKSLAAREYMAYMVELLSDPKIYYQKVAPTFWKEAKQEVLSIVEENFGYRPKVRNAREFVELLGRFSQDARRGLGFTMKASRLADLEEFDFLGIEFVENNKRNEVARFASKDLVSEKQQLIERNKKLVAEKPEGYLEQAKLNNVKLRKINENLRISEANEKNIKIFKETESGTSKRVRAENELLKDNTPIIETWFKNNFKKGLDVSESDFRGSMNEQVAKIFNSYKDLNVPFGYYLKSRLQPQLGNILRRAQAGRTTDIAFSEVSVDAETLQIADVSPELSRFTTGPEAPKGRELVKDLNIPEDVITKVEQRLSKLNIDKLTYKTLKDLAPEYTNELLGVTPKTGNLGKGSVENAQKWFNKDSNAQLFIDVLPEGTVPMKGAPEAVKGTSTGVQNVLLKEFYNKAERAKTKAGAVVQVKRNDITTQQVKDFFGIKPDGTFVELKNDRGLSQKIKSAVDQIGKAWTNQVARGTLEAREGMQMTSNRIEAGKSEALASKVLDNYFEKFPKSTFEQAQDAFYKAYLGDKKSLTKKQNQYFENIGLEPGLMTREQALLFGYADAKAMTGKAKRKGFDVDIIEANIKPVSTTDGRIITPAEIKSINLKANYRVSKGDVIIDVPRTNKFVDHSVEFAKLLPAEIAKNLSFFDQILFLHQRTTFEGEARGVKKDGGKIIGENGEIIANQPFTRGRERSLEVLGENTLKEIWDGIGFKFNKATSQVTGQKSYAKAKTEAERAAIVEKYFSQPSESTKAKIHNGIASTMEAYVHSGKTKAEVLSRMEWAANAMRSNSNLRLGLRQTAPILAIYKGPGKMTDAKWKLEHLKTSKKQSSTSFELITQNKWRQYGPETLKDFVGVLAPKKLLDIIDAKGGAVNAEALYRMAILEPKTLSEFVTIKSKGKQTLLDYVLETAKLELNKKALKETLSQELLLKENISKLDKVGLLPDAKIGAYLASKHLGSHDKAIIEGRNRNKKARGMSTFDFDETLIIKGENFVTATKGKETIKISSEKFPIEGPKLEAEGYKFDFKDFVNVKGGVEGPLFKKLQNQIAKYGNENVYVLTARMQEAAPAIHAWLKSKGVELPIDNITGLGKSAGEAKALWMLEKFAEGYNDMYFVDDALPNVKAVKNVLNQLDIKSKVQQALASKDLNKGINDIVEYSLGIESKKKFSKAEGKIRGKDIKRRRLFIPDSAADLELLIEPLYGKGKKGTENKKWFEREFIKPWERGINDFNNARQAITNDYMSLRKNNKDVVKLLDKPVEGTNFTHDMAMRVYIWNKNGFKIPDLTKTSEQKLIEHVKNNPKLQAYAESVAKLTKLETGLKEPSAEWWGETIAGEVSDVGRGVGRKKYIQDWVDVKNEIFSEENLNKMESKLGTRWRESVEDMFDRMETGRTRSMKMGRLGNDIMNYLNGSVGAIMNLNTRSATLQLISTVNFINHSFNNPLAATRAFANQKQYWKDFMEIMNSDMLKQRRAGLEINVTEAELAAATKGKKNKASAAIAWILKQGYIPTKIADSFAIASGGATYYRNAIRKYTKEGLSKAEAEKKAWIDFQTVAERTQQSSRPDLLSQQQTSFEGRLILPFANTPMQMNRIMMKELLDLSKGRWKGAVGDNSFTNKMSKISYYGFVQSALFAGLQSGLFALMANSDDDELKAKKKVQAVNTLGDSFLRGMGIQGAVLSGVKNATVEFINQNEKGWGSDYSEVGEDLLNISPTIGSKFSKLDAAGNTYSWNKKEIAEEGFTLDGPALEATTQVVEAITNIPTNRAHKKVTNISNALNNDYEAWQRLMVGLGWSQWDVGIGQEKAAEKKKEKKEKKAKEKKESQQRCTKIKSDGTRCRIMVKKPKKRCHYHD